MLTREAVEEAYELFEKARDAVADDPKARAHVDAARMVLQYALLEELPAADPRIQPEMEDLLRMAKALEMPTVQSVRLNEYRAKIMEKIASSP